MLAQVIGFIGNDAEILESNGKNYLKFSIADTQRAGGQDVTVWVKCFFHNEKMGQWLKKGKQVFISGELTTTTYEGKLDLTMNVQNLKFCGKKDE